MIFEKLNNGAYINIFSPKSIYYNENFDLENLKTYKNYLKDISKKNKLFKSDLININTSHSTNYHLNNDDFFKPLLDKIINESKMPGKILNEEERKRWGISSEKFGDYIDNIMPKGLCYVPDWQLSDVKDQISDKLPYITEGQKVSIIFHNDNPVSIELSASVELKVIEAEPGYKGNTAQGGTKPVKLETGLVINVPLFVEENDILKVDTRNGNYLSRA